MNASELRINFLVRLTAATLFAIAFASAAEAATVTCPDPVGTGNYVEIEYTGGLVLCTDFGSGNTFPNASDDPLHYYGVDFDYVGDCLSSANCADVDSTGSTSGTFDINSPGGAFLLLFKFGQGQTDPNWFLVGMAGVTSGNWELLPDAQNGLSHVALWSRAGVPQQFCTNPAGCDENPPVVPEPASLLLIGTGLFGAAAAKRRASKAQPKA